MLRSGWAFSYETLPSKRRQILQFLVPGDIFDQDAVVLPPSRVLFSTRTLTDAEICLFSVADYRALSTASAKIRRVYAGQLRSHLSLLGRRLVDLGQRHALARVAALLLELHQRLREHDPQTGGDVSFPLRQEHIADALGMTETHVNRMLRSLRSAELIEIRRGWLRMLAPEGIEAIAGKL